MNNASRIIRAVTGGGRETEALPQTRGTQIPFGIVAATRDPYNNVNFDDF